MRLDACASTPSEDAEAEPCRVAEYEYVDRQRDPIARKVRLEPGRGGQRKYFFWEVLDADTGNWRSAKAGEGNPRVLYNLPLLSDADRIHVCEGEKAADALVNAGVVATCAPTTGWLPEYTDSIAQASAPVTLWVDRDEAGETQARRSLDAMRQAGVQVEVVRGRIDEPRADAHDHLREGFGPDDGEPFDLDLAVELAPGSIPMHRAASSGDLVFTRFSDVEPEEVEWLFAGYIPKGKITISNGDPEAGKSTTSIDIAARVTIGRSMPDGSPGILGNVVVIGSEDGLADTMLPRFLAAEGDPERAVLINGVRTREEGVPTLFELPGDVSRLEEMIVQEGAALVVIDPLTAFLAAEVNAYVDKDIRRALTPLAQMAERTGVAVLVIRHLNKSAGGDNPLYRGAGSIGITGIARQELLTARDPEDENRRVLAVSKASLGPKAPSLSFRIVPFGTTSRIEWLGEAGFTARQLLSEPSSTEERSARDEASEFVRDVLAAGPVAAADVFKRGKAEGFGEKAVRGAKDRLGVKSKKLGFEGGWKWIMPEHMPTEDGAGLNASVSGHLGDLGRLQGMNADIEGLTKTVAGEDPQDAPSSTHGHLREGDDETEIEEVLL